MPATVPGTSVFVDVDVIAVVIASQSAIFVHAELKLKTLLSLHPVSLMPPADAEKQSVYPLPWISEPGVSLDQPS